MQFDYDNIDEWASRLDLVLAPLLPANIAAMVKEAKPEYVEDARDIVIKSGGLTAIGNAVLDWLRCSTVMAYHGTRLTSEEVASVEQHGFLPLKVANRKTRLARALAGHPRWPEAVTRLNEVCEKFANGYAGGREGQIHFTLSRAGLAGFDHYIAYGAEVDQHMAVDLVGVDGYELLGTDGTPIVYKIVVPGEIAVDATHRYFAPEQIMEMGDVPNMAGDILNAWSYRFFKPDYQSKNLRIDCGLIFYEPLPPSWIVSKEVVEFAATEDSLLD